jgi:hypothetical protein
MKIPFWNNIKNSLEKNNCDRININLWGLDLKVARDSSIDIPTELSVIIPRVELRHKYRLSPFPSYEKEIIMNSITVVLSPRHSSEKKSSTDNYHYLSNKNPHSKAITNRKIPHVNVL